MKNWLIFSQLLVLIIFQAQQLKIKKIHTSNTLILIQINCLIFFRSHLWVEFFTILLNILIKIVLSPQTLNPSLRKFNFNLFQELHNKNCNIFTILFCDQDGFSSQNFCHQIFIFQKCGFVRSFIQTDFFEEINISLGLILIFLQNQRG